MKKPVYEDSILSGDEGPGGMNFSAEAFRQELRSRLRQNADRVLLRLVLSGRSMPVELTGAEILERAPALAARYVDAPKAGVVLLLLPHSEELFLLHIGLLLEGRVPAILAWPTSRMDPEKYRHNLLHQLRHLPARQLITLPQLAASLSSGLQYSVTACAIEAAGTWTKSIAIPRGLESLGLVPPPSAWDAPSDALFLQFSGGTTGNQKAVIVTARMLKAQLAYLAEVLNFTEIDGVASWLPLYHDMGLIACLWLGLWHGAPSLQMSASDWLVNPESLFQYVDRYGATFCWLPNFAFAYLAAQRRRMKGSYRLGHVRAWINCSEPVRMGCLASFRAAFAEWGVRIETLQASYGFAENVFAVTQTELGSPPRTYPRKLLVHRLGSPNTLGSIVLDEVYVSSGELLKSTTVQIVDAEGRECVDYEPGNILVRSDSLFSGYWTSDGFITSVVSPAGWYATGDYGFRGDGHLYVIGRSKDIIIVGGQNVFPEDIESIVNSSESVYPGRVVAFGVEDHEYGTESIAVVAEMRGDFDVNAAERVEREIKQLVLSTIGISPRYVAVVPERWIVKSTAGKISRRETSERFAREFLQDSVAV